jgi:hypothetical protein
MVLVAVDVVVRIPSLILKSSKEPISLTVSTILIDVVFGDETWIIRATIFINTLALPLRGYITLSMIREPIFFSNMTDLGGSPIFRSGRDSFAQFASPNIIVTEVIKISEVHSN